MAIFVLPIGVFVSANELKLVFVPLVISLAFAQGAYAQTTAPHGPESQVRAETFMVGGGRDESGLLSVALFERTSGKDYNHFDNFTAIPPNTYTVIGGGGMGCENPGNMLTTSANYAHTKGWQISSKDHLVRGPCQAKVWAIGIKTNVPGIPNLSGSFDLNPELGPHPKVQYPTSSAVPRHDIVVGGGFYVVGGEKVPSNFAFETYPSYEGWTVASKDHGMVHPAYIHSLVVSIRSEFRGSDGKLMGRFERVVVPVESTYASHPQSSAFLPSGYVLTGCGAKVNFASAGNLLYKIRPIINASQQGCEAASKDHIYFSPATITTFAIGIKFVPEPGVKLKLPPPDVIKGGDSGGGDSGGGDSAFAW